MTERLFDFDSYTKEFTATVLECFEQNGKWLIVLDKTAFFPEGGGQYGDKGALDSTPVIDTIEKNGEIYHITEQEIPVGTKVKGVLDWEFRFNNMQNHSGEHIVSGIVHSVFGLNNVGFHVGTDFVTLDYNGVLTKEQLVLVEQKANEVVASNLEIFASYPEKESLKNLNYRSKKEILGDIRIVEIPTVDICACCAPHVHSTAEVGLIKLLDFKNYKGGIRVNMLCGLRALEDYNKRYETTAVISNKLSCKQYECAAAVDILLNEISELKTVRATLENQLAESITQNIENQEGNIVKFCDLSGDALRVLADKGKEKCGGLFVALNGDDANGYKYVIAGNVSDFSEKIKQLNKALNGRGGGKSPMAQGMFLTTKEEILKCFE